jgi:uncharacterized delta-60 repeat protein
MRYFALFFTVFVITSPLILTAQVQEAWISYYDAGTGGDAAYALAIDNDDNVIVTGASNADYATVKYDRHGNELWVARYIGPYGLEAARDIALDSEGNIYVTGESKGGAGIELYDYLTIKYDPDGNELWVRRYDNPSGERDYATAIDVDEAGNCYVTGYCLFVNYQIATIKYDTDGSEEWVAIYDDLTGDDVGYDIVVDGDDQVYITGYSRGEVTGPDYITIKYDANGEQMWAELYDRWGSFWGDLAYAIALDGSGNVYVTGMSDDSTTNYDYTTIKYDNDGSTLWTARYDGGLGHDDKAHDMVVDHIGNVYVTGGSSENFATVKYDSDGNELWASVYDGPHAGLDIARAIALDDRGNIYVTGESSPGFITFDYATVKYNSEGEEIWAMRYEPPGSNAYVSDIAVDSAGNVVVTGEDLPGSFDSQYTTVKYRQNPLIHREAVPLR